MGFGWVDTPHRPADRGADGRDRGRATAVGGVNVTAGRPRHAGPGLTADQEFWESRVPGTRPGCYAT